MKTNLKILLLAGVMAVLFLLNLDLYLNGFKWWQMAAFTIVIVVLSGAIFTAITIKKAAKTIGRWEEYD